MTAARTDAHAEPDLDELDLDELMALSMAASGMALGSEADLVHSRALHRAEPALLAKAREADALAIQLADTSERLRKAEDALAYFRGRGLRLHLDIEDDDLVQVRAGALRDCARLAPALNGEKATP